MKKIFLFLMIVFANSYSAEQAKNNILKVKVVAKYVIDIPFNSKSTIYDIKKAIKESEGIHIEVQKLYKFEDQKILIIPTGKLKIELQDYKTCAEYDLIDNSEVHLFLQLKNNNSDKDIIDALNFRRKKISEAFHNNALLPKELVELVKNYSYAQENDNIENIIQSLNQ